MSKLRTYELQNPDSASVNIELTPSGGTVLSGVVTATTLKVGTGVTISSGVVSATSFSGDGSALTGIDATSLKDSGGNVKVQANTSGAVVTGVLTSTSFSGPLTGNLTGDVNAGVVTATSSINVGNSFINATSIGIGTTDTAGRNAGVSTAVGTLIYNSTSQQVEVFDGNRWNGGLASPFSATGGTKDTTSRSGYAVHTFTEPGSLIAVAGPGSIDFEYLVVAGGGGAGGNGGGGGAGGMRTGTLSGVAPGTYTIQVGGGGAGDGGSTLNNGTPSFISNPGITSITSAGGGYGTQTFPGNPYGGPGGSGGGGAGYYGPVLLGGTGNTPPTSPPQGNNGGDGINGTAYGYSGGGGGGAGGAGSNGSPTNGGNGGNGSPSSITGTSVTYAGGGGGNGAGTVSPGTSTGGTGGGGDGIKAGGVPSNPGAVNSGGGAGAGGNSASGGSGIVIIAYPTS